MEGGYLLDQLIFLGAFGFGGLDGKLFVPSHLNEAKVNVEKGVIMKSKFMNQSHFDVMKGMMSEALDDLFCDSFPNMAFNSGDYRPAADILESFDMITVILELPGVAKNDFRVSMEDGVLSVSGRRRIKPAGQSARILLKELGSGKFQRKFRIGVRVDINNIDATLKEGLLTIKLPKVRKDT